MDVRERPLHDWRLSLQPDLQDALAKALWHHRIDLWYGAHYLRFTQTETPDARRCCCASRNRPGWWPPTAATRGCSPRRSSHRA